MLMTKKYFFFSAGETSAFYEFICIFYITKVPIYGAYVKLCLFFKQKWLFMSFYEANTLLLNKRVSVGKVKLRTHLSRNLDLHTSEAHFIKKSALRGTAATCDSLVTDEIKTL